MQFPVLAIPTLLASALSSALYFRMLVGRRTALPLPTDLLLSVLQSPIRDGWRTPAPYHVRGRSFFTSAFQFSSAGHMTCATACAICFHLASSFNSCTFPAAV